MTPITKALIKIDEIEKKTHKEEGKKVSVYKKYKERLEELVSIGKKRKRSIDAKGMKDFYFCFEDEYLVLLERMESEL